MKKAKGFFPFAFFGYSQSSMEKKVTFNPSSIAV